MSIDKNTLDEVNAALAQKDASIVSDPFVDDKFVYTAPGGVEARLSRGDLEIAISNSTDEDGDLLIDDLIAEILENSE